MEYIAIVLLAIVAMVVVVAFIMAFCKLNSNLSREEEEALHTHLYVGLDDNRCVCCGEIIPEGRQVCPICERIVNKT